MSGKRSSKYDDINSNRKKLRDKLYPNWNDMSAQEKALASVLGNVDEMHGTYETSEDMEDLEHQFESEQESTYVTNYLKEWHEYCVIKEFEQQVEDDLIWLRDNRPGAITEILNSGDIRATIEYIYPHSADFTDIYTRHHNIIDFWEDMTWEYA